MADVILTGASRGIGRALALKVGGTGRASRMVLVARDRTRLESLVADIEKLGGRAIAVCGDLSSLAGAETLGRQLSGRTAGPPLRDRPRSSYSEPWHWP